MTVKGALIQTKKTRINTSVWGLGQAPWPCYTLDKRMARLAAHPGDVAGWLGTLRWPSSVDDLGLGGCKFQRCTFCKRIGLERGMTLNLLFPKITETDVLLVQHQFQEDQELRFGVAADSWVACLAWWILQIHSM